MNVFCYEDMVQSALLDVVKNSLKYVEKNGFHGDHHFYISYLTNYPGVVIPQYLKEKHQNEIMIVLQYQYEHLHVSNDSFSVTLSFNGKPENLVVPFASIIAFVDPSVKFGLQFTPKNIDPNGTDDRDLDSKNAETCDGCTIINFDNLRKK